MSRGTEFGNINTAVGRKRPEFGRFSGDKVILIVIQDFADHFRETDQRNYVRNHHQAVEKVGQFPNECDVQERAHHDEAENENAIDRDPATSRTGI
ncbi:hypothetical protein EVA_16855 [gut metagenome]|uniref:Uncharacterized protein n=1 Tax=gut metagenome TaxID=749906 RepID=J9G6F1_9ZZZZ